MKTLLEWTASVQADTFVGVKGAFFEPSFWWRLRQLTEDAKVKKYSLQLFKPEIYTRLLDSRIFLCNDTDTNDQCKIIVLNLDLLTVTIEVNSNWEDYFQYEFAVRVIKNKYYLYIYKRYVRSHEVVLVGKIKLKRFDKYKIINEVRFGSTTFTIKTYEDAPEAELYCFKKLSK